MLADVILSIVLIILVIIFIFIKCSCSLSNKCDKIKYIKEDEIEKKRKKIDKIVKKHIDK